MEVAPTAASVLGSAASLGLEGSGNATEIKPLGFLVKYDPPSVTLEYAMPVPLALATSPSCVNQFPVHASSPPLQQYPPQPPLLQPPPMSCRKLTEALYEPSSPIYLAMVPRPPPPAIEEGACTPDASTSGSPERTSPAARKVSRLQAAIDVAQHLTAPETTADGRPPPETRARATTGAEQVYHLQMRLKPRSLHNTVDDCHQTALIRKPFSNGRFSKI